MTGGVERRPNVPAALRARLRELPGHLRARHSRRTTDRVFPLALCFLLFFLSLMGGCGLHLRGSRGEFKSIPPIYVAGQDPAVIPLRQFLRVGGTTVVDDRTQAQIVLTILDARRERRVLSVGTTGRVAEYELKYELPFYADDDRGRRLMDVQTVSQTRRFQFSETDVVAKANEEDYLFRDMQRSAVMDIVRRIPTIARKLQTAEPHPAEPAGGAGSIPESNPPTSPPGPNPDGETP
jgi:LPS-assembly lipoprotein